MSKAYKIERITDVLAIPEDRFDDFLVDFKTFYQLGRDMTSLIDEIAEVGGIKTKTTPKYMNWIDDGEHNVTVYITPKENP